MLEGGEEEGLNDTNDTVSRDPSIGGSCINKRGEDLSMIYNLLKFQEDRPSRSKKSRGSRFFPVLKRLKIQITRLYSWNFAK